VPQSSSCAILGKTLVVANDATVHRNQRRRLPKSCRLVGVDEETAKRRVLISLTILKLSGRGSGKMRLKYAKHINFGLFIIVALAIPVALVMFTKAGMHIFTRDVFALTKSPPILGFLSNVGAFVWCASLSSIVLTIFTVRYNTSGTVMWFLYSSAIITGWLLFDDFFMLHDFWIKRIGMRSFHAYIGLGVALIIYITIFFRIIIKTNYLLFLLAFGFLSVSVAIDMGESLGFWQDNDWRWYYLFEDGSKWIGICFWAAYFFSTSRRVLIANFADQLKRDDDPLGKASHSAQLR